MHLYSLQFFKIVSIIVKFFRLAVQQVEDYSEIVPM